MGLSKCAREEGGGFDLSVEVRLPAVPEMPPTSSNSANMHVPKISIGTPAQLNRFTWATMGILMGILRHVNYEAVRAHDSKEKCICPGPTLMCTRRPG